MTKEQRQALSKGLIELANIIAGALVFGQLVVGERFDFGVFNLGVLLAFALYTWALALTD
jgi:hypothetical protein